MRSLFCLSSFGYMSPSWLEPALKPEPINRLPSWQHLSNFGVVCWRIGWSFDATVPAFKWWRLDGGATARELQFMHALHLEPRCAHPDARTSFRLRRASTGQTTPGRGRIPMTYQHDTIRVDEKARAMKGNGHNGWKAHSDWLDGVTFDEVDPGPGRVRLRLNLSRVCPETHDVRRFSRRVLLTDLMSITVLDEIETSRLPPFTGASSRRPGDHRLRVGGATLSDRTRAVRPQPFRVRARGSHCRGPAELDGAPSRPGPVGPRRAGGARPVAQSGAPCGQFARRNSLFSSNMTTYLAALNRKQGADP